MFNGIFDAIEEWMRSLLTGIINSNLSTMFTDVNEKTGEIAAQVGQTPQGWNSSIFSMIRSLSESVILPIAGIIITFVLCYELISMLTEKNNMHEIDTWMFFKYFVKMWIAVYLVSHTFTITMAVFDVGQHIVNNAAGVITGNTAIDISSALTNLEATMEAMEIGELTILMLETLIVSFCMKIMTVWITVILYGTYDRDLSVYFGCTCSVCNNDKQGMGTDWNKLFQRVVCPRISGISYDGMCRHLCGTGGRNPVIG